MEGAHGGTIQKQKVPNGQQLDLRELQALKCLLCLDPCRRLLCTFIIQSSDVTDAKFRAMTTVQSDALTYVTTALELRWMKPGGECCSSLSLKRGFWGRATVLYSNDSAMSNCRCLLVQTCKVEGVTALLPSTVASVGHCISSSCGIKIRN